MSSRRGHRRRRPIRLWVRVCRSSWDERYRPDGGGVLTDVWNFSCRILPMPKGASPVYGFGPFVLDVSDRSLKRDGAAISLTPKQFDLLVALVESAGRLVEKDTLLQRVWPDVAVEEGNLTKGVFSLRQVLEGDGPTGYIETVPKRGYRFTADVTSAQQEAPARSPALVAATAPQENS